MVWKQLQLPTRFVYCTIVEDASQCCPDCHSTETTAQTVYEHVACGCIQPHTLFGDGCPKCGDEADPESLNAVGTVRHCEDCGTRWVPEKKTDHSATDNQSEQPALESELDAYRFHTDDRDGWLTGIRNRIGRRPTVVLFVLVIAAVGIGGAAIVTPMLAEEPSEPATVAADAEWESYETIVVFRNDDIQPWYKQETMRAVDQIFIDEDVPVTLGVIPAVGGSDSTITESDETCRYLQSLLTEHPGQFEMATHGYTHEERTGFHGGSEFGGIDAETQQTWMNTSTELMVKCTGVQPQTFIPPMNTYDEATVVAANAAGYQTMSGGDWFTDRYYNETGVFHAGGALHISEGASFVADWETNEFYSQDELEAAFDDSYAENELHIQMLHYQEFDSDASQQQLRELIQHMKETNTTFLTLDQLATGLESGEIRETDDGWDVREPLTEPENSPDRLADGTAGSPSWLPFFTTETGQ